jgi:phage-related protein
LAAQNPDARRIDSPPSQEELLESVLRQLSFLTEEIRKANLIQLHRIMAEQTGRALADPALAEAMSTLQGMSESRRRQVLFVNAQYSAIMLHHRLGAIDWDELVGYLRVWCSNGVFQEYWDMTGDARRALPRESLEARVGRAVDEMMEEIASGREWWVVGPSE